MQFGDNDQFGFFAPKWVSTGDLNPLMPLSNGNGTRIIPLDPSWTPQYNNIVSYFKCDGTGSIANGATILPTIGPNGFATVATSTYAYDSAGQVDSCIFNNTSQPNTDTNFFSYLTTAPLQLTKGTLVGWVRGDFIGDSFRGIIANPGSYNILTSGQEFGSYDYSANAFRGSSVNIADGPWHHVAATFEYGSVNTLQLYVDGQLKANHAFGFASNNASISFGSLGSGNVIAGRLDELAIWNVVLTAQEIATIYAWQTQNNNNTRSYSPVWAPYYGSIIQYDSLDGSGTLTTGQTLTCNIGINGTVTGSLDYVQGQVNQGLYASQSVTSYVTHASNPIFFIAQATILFWVKTDGSTQTSFRGLVVNEGNWSMYMLDGVLIVYDWNTFTGRTTGVNINDGNWHHCAMVYDSGTVNGTKVYIDGVLVLSTTCTTTDMTKPVYYFRGVSAGQEFKGIMDEIAIYTQRLTAVQVLAIYNRQIGNFS